MELKRMTEVPKDYEGYESTALDQSEAKYFASCGLEKAWYWYGVRPYEGSGAIIGLKDGKYCMKDIGHCSCYGPTGIGISDYDNWKPEAWHDSLDDLLANVSASYTATSVGPLVQFVKDNP
jgi:hypothetical protein